MDAVSPEVRRRPLIRVSQVVSACSFCKARKIKCDGITPACGGCVKFGRAATCSLLSGSGRQAKDYPTYLHQRAERLKSYLERMKEDPPFDDDETDHHREHITSEKGQRDADVQQTPTLVDTLIADIGALPIQASTYSMDGDGATLSNILLGAASQSKLSPLLPSSHNTDVQCPEYLHILPNNSVALKLANIYLDKIYPRLPFFSIQGFWVQFNSVFQQNSIDESQGPTTRPARQEHDLYPRSGSRSPDVSKEYSIFTVLLVLSIAISSLSRSTDSAISNQAQRLFNAALPYRNSAIKPNTIIGVQSLLFLIQYATLNPSTLNAWYLIGVGMRTCIDLGLHQDPQPPETVSPSLLETRRRLWWSMYSFDRSFSMGCGRPTEISDNKIDVCLPSFRVESVATEDQIQGYLQRYRILQIQSEIYEALDRVGNFNTTYDLIRKLSGKLEDWARENAPTHSQILVESELLMGRMLLYRPCRMIPERTRIEIEQLWKSAVRFTALYRQLVDSNAIFYIQIAAEKIYWVGLAMLYSFWWLSKDQPGQWYHFELWKSVQDVLFIIRILSERWDDGGILAKQFEASSKEVLMVLESRGTGGTDISIPEEVAHFATYISLTSLRANSKQLMDTGSDAELKQLMLDIVA